MNGSQICLWNVVVQFVESVENSIEEGNGADHDETKAAGGGKLLGQGDRLQSQLTHQRDDRLAAVHCVHRFLQGSYILEKK